VSETNADDTLLTVNVNTVAGQQTISRQAVERGQLVEEVVTADLAAAHNAELDRQVINGSGASGQHLGILGISGITSITYTDATPTPGELWPKLADAVRQVGAQRFTRATHLEMNPLTWGWLLSTLDTTGRPLFAVGGSEGAFDTMGASDNAGYSDFAGSMLGCRVLLSGNVPNNLGGGSTETRIIAADLRDSFLWENSKSPVFIRAEQPNVASLGILFVAYSFSAFAGGSAAEGHLGRLGDRPDPAGAVRAFPAGLAANAARCHVAKAGLPGGRLRRPWRGSRSSRGCRCCRGSGRCSMWRWSATWTVRRWCDYADEQAERRALPANVILADCEPRWLTRLQRLVTQLVRPMTAAPPSGLEASLTDPDGGRRVPLLGRVKSWISSALGRACPRTAGEVVQRAGSGQEAAGSMYLLGANCGTLRRSVFRVQSAVRPRGDMTGGISMGQKDWRFCVKDRVMFFDGDPGKKGSCAATGPHVSLGINFDLPHDVPETPTAQGGWRFCDKCFAMFFDGDPAKKGSCPTDGGGHHAAGFAFVLPHDIPETATGQGGWRFCDKCFAMFFDGDPANKGVCNKGGQHEAAGFAFVLPHHDEVQTFDSGPLTSDLPLGGSAHLVITKSGAFTFSTHAHDSGFDNIHYALVAVLMTPSAVGFTVAHQGGVEGTSGSLLGSPRRDDDQVSSGSNPAISREFGTLSNSVFIAKLAGRDALLTGTAELIHDAVHSALDAFGLQQAKALITLLDT
jgi:hypothetical protein